MEDTLICYCLGYTTQDLKAAISQGHTQLQDLQRHLGACTRCHGCKADILDLLTEVSMAAQKRV